MLVSFRLLAAALLAWVAWMTARAPYQERSNRLLALFLAFVALEFFLESLWFDLKADPSIAGPLKKAQEVVGILDPPLLLAYAATFPRPPPWWNTKVFAGASTVAVAALLALLETGQEAAFKVSLACINVVYLAAFLALLLRSTRQRKGFLSRQLFYASLATGFVALSRTPTFFLDQDWGSSGGALPSIASAAAVCSAILVVVSLLAWAWRDKQASPAGPLLACLAALLGLFFLAWALVLVPSGDFPAFFALRWVFFSAIMGHGILRHQIFDFQEETWKGTIYLVASSVGAIVHPAAWQALAGGELGQVAGTGLALLCGGSTLFLLQTLLRWAWRRVRPTPAAQPASRQILLEIYETTMDYALGSGPVSDRERRLVETLRDLFGISPEEHAAILARLTGQGTAAAAARTEALAADLEGDRIQRQSA